MRKVLAAMGILTMFGFGVAAATQTERKPQDGQVCTLKVNGMACGACAARVEKEAKKIDGVKAAKVSQPKGAAEITYDPARTTPQAIAKTITEKTGFASAVTPKPATPKQ